MAIVAKRKAGGAGARRPAGRPTPALAGLALLVALLCAGAWLLAGRKDAPPGRHDGVALAEPGPSEGVAARPKRSIATPDEQPRREPQAKAARTGPGHPEGVAAHTENTPRHEGPAASTAPTEAAQDAVPAQEDPPKHERPRRVFSSPAEQVISSFANARPGYPPPIMMRFPAGRSVEEILDTPVEILEDDDEATVALKENCARLKEDIRAYIAEGGTAENFLLAYHNELSKDYEDWQSSQRRIVQLLKEGALEEAERFAEAANADFAARGVRQVTLPTALVKRITGE